MHPRGRLWKKAVNISLCREVRSRARGTGDPLGVLLTWAFTLPGGAARWGGGALSCMGMQSTRPGYACCHQSICVPGSTVLGFGTASRRPLPLRWLHHRQITAVLSSVSVPPLL